MVSNIGTVALILVAALLGALLVLFIAVAVSKGVFRRLEGPLTQRIAANYRPEEILLQDLRANSFGQESTGRLRLRGNGALVLTETSLHFFLFLPRLEVVVPLETITDVSIAKSHLGKTVFYPLLKVAFSRNGMHDSIAWYVADGNAWKSRIDAHKADRAAGAALPDAIA